MSTFEYNYTCCIIELKYQSYTIVQYYIIDAMLKFIYLLYMCQLCLLLLLFDMHCIFTLS